MTPKEIQVIRKGMTMTISNVLSFDDRPCILLRILKIEEKIFKYSYAHIHKKKKNYKTSNPK